MSVPDAMPRHPVEKQNAREEVCVRTEAHNAVLGNCWLRAVSLIVQRRAQPGRRARLVTLTPYSDQTENHFID